MFKASTGEGRGQAETPRVMQFIFFVLALNFGVRGDLLFLSSRKQNAPLHTCLSSWVLKTC